MSTWISNRGTISYAMLNPSDASKGARAPGIQEAERITDDARTAGPCAIFKISL
jgi:hypothetical protein